MSNYTFTFRKDNIVVDFMTTDKEVVERQFHIWVDAASDYAKSHPAKAKAVKAAPEAPAENAVETPKAEAPVVATPIVEEPPKTEVAETKAEVIEEKVEAPSQETAEVFDKASSLLKTINSIQGENEEVKESPTPAVDFDALLEKTIENPTFEPARVKDQVFLNLINSKDTMDKFHYLMITAYYLSEFEKLERFSLKQINAKLMHNMSELIDHSMLQEAINQGFIELVPDLTGVAEVGEYRLTPAGEDFFANKI